MHCAAYGDNHYMITYLNEKGISIHEADNDGSTPLHIACNQKAERAAKWLMGFGADVTASNVENLTPLHMITINPKPFASKKTVVELIIRGVDKT